MVGFNGIVIFIAVKDVQMMKDKLKDGWDWLVKMEDSKNGWLVK